MLIEPADDPAYRKVTFTWTNPDPARPPRDVLVRLQTLTDKAWADGDLSPFLLAPAGNGTWRTTLEFRADLRVSYRFYLDFDGILRGVMPGEEQWYGDMRTGTFADPLNHAPSPDWRPGRHHRCWNCPTPHPNHGQPRVKPTRPGPSHATR